jgi:hypothetical protein
VSGDKFALSGEFFIAVMGRAIWSKPLREGHRIGRCGETDSRDGRINSSGWYDKVAWAQAKSGPATFFISLS